MIVFFFKRGSVEKILPPPASKALSRTSFRSFSRATSISLREWPCISVLSWPNHMMSVSQWHCSSCGEEEAENNASFSVCCRRLSDTLSFPILTKQALLLLEERRRKGGGERREADRANVAITPVSDFFSCCLKYWFKIFFLKSWYKYLIDCCKVLMLSLLLTCCFLGYLGSQWGDRKAIFASTTVLAMQRTTWLNAPIPKHTPTQTIPCFAKKKWADGPFCVALPLMDANSTQKCLWWIVGKIAKEQKLFWKQKFPCDLNRFGRIWFFPCN